MSAWINTPFSSIFLAYIKGEDYVTNAEMLIYIREINILSTVKSNILPWFALLCALNVISLIDQLN